MRAHVGFEGSQLCLDREFSGTLLLELPRLQLEQRRFQVRAHDAVNHRANSKEHGQNARELGPGTECAPELPRLQ